MAGSSFRICRTGRVQCFSYITGKEAHLL
jgi:hypothetical protein